MAFENLVGLHVVDEGGYATYREQMLPILTRFGGSFGCDFVVSEVLKSTVEGSINRVFTIRFPTEDAKNRFFADAEYREVRREHFEPSVSEAHILAEYER